MESSLREPEEGSEAEDGNRRRKEKPKSLLDEIGTVCKSQSTLTNSFGNIIINTGNGGIVGGTGLPCISVSQEAAKLIGYWDHEAGDSWSNSFHFSLIEFVLPPLS